MMGNTAEAWSYCTSRSDSDMLQVRFSCPFVTSEYSVKMAATIEVCTKDRQHSIVRFLLSQRMKGQRSIDN